MYINLVLIVLVNIIVHVQQINSQATKHLEKDAINDLVNQMRNKVLPQIPPTSAILKFRNDDLYWVKWLESTSFDPENARLKFLAHLKWREDEKIDTINLEDWSYYQSEYPAYLDSVDKMGRPIIELWFSDWNVRGSILAGRVLHLKRWVVYLYEMGMRRLFELRAAGATNGTAGIELIEYDGLNMIQHGCATCMSLYGQMARVWEQHYPGTLEEVYMLNGKLFHGSRKNVSYAHKFVINVWKQSVSPAASKALKPYGMDAKEWLPTLQKKIDSDQLDIRFGGTRKRQS